MGNAAVFAATTPTASPSATTSPCPSWRRRIRRSPVRGRDRGRDRAGVADRSGPDPGLRAADFVVAKVTVEDIELLGMPTSSSTSISLGSRSCSTGAARSRPHRRRADTITGSNSWIDWEASFRIHGGDTGSRPSCRSRRAPEPRSTSTSTTDHRCFRRPGHAEDLRLRLHHGRLRVRAGDSRSCHFDTLPDGPRADEPRRGARRGRLDGRRRQHHAGRCRRRRSASGRVGFRGLQPGRLRGRGRKFTGVSSNAYGLLATGSTSAW